MRTRRQFVLSASAVCAAATLPGKLLAQSAAQNVFAPAYLGAYLQNSLSFAVFRSLVGSTFRAQVGSGRYASLQLTAATPSSTTQIASSTRVTLQGKAGTANGSLRGAAIRPGTERVVNQGTTDLPAPVEETESFDLSFSSTDAPFPQDSYVVDHATLGRFSMMLVPDRPGSGVYYASFYYLVPTMQAGNPAPIYNGRRAGGTIAPSPLAGSTTASPASPASPITLLQGAKQSVVPVRSTGVQKALSLAD